MRKISRYLTLLITLLPCVASAADEIEFNRDVRPILTNHCFA